MWLWNGSGRRREADLLFVRGMDSGGRDGTVGQVGPPRRPDGLCPNGPPSVVRGEEEREAKVARRRVLRCRNTPVPLPDAPALLLVNFTQGAKLCLQFRIVIFS